MGGEQVQHRLLDDFCESWVADASGGADGRLDYGILAIGEAPGRRQAEHVRARLGLYGFAVADIIAPAHEVERQHHAQVFFRAGARGGGEIGAPAHVGALHAIGDCPGKGGGVHVEGIAMDFHLKISSKKSLD